MPATRAPTSNDEQDIGKLFVADIVPGLLAVLMYMATITIIGRVRPEFLPAGKRAAWRERLRAMREVWATLGLFLFVIGGIYGVHGRRGGRNGCRWRLSDWHRPRSPIA
jgi:TRAP-type C4-dicarboxylate transport system permease large subunit